MISIGKSKAPIRVSSLHSHLTDEVILNISGSGKIKINNQIFTFEPGSIIYVPKGEKHQKVPKDTFEDIYIQLDESLFYKAVTGNDDENKSIQKLMELIHYSFYKNGQKIDTVISSMLLSLKEMLKKAFDNEKKQTPADALFCGIINNFSDAEFSLSEEMKKTGYSSDYLRRAFFAKYGISPKEFLIKLRLEKSVSMMRNGDYDISELSISCGYYDASYFSRLFKKKYKMTPTEYKKSVLS